MIACTKSTMTPQLQLKQSREKEWSWFKAGGQRVCWAECSLSREFVEQRVRWADLSREFVEQRVHWAESRWAECSLGRELAEQIWAESSLSSRRERKAKQQLGKVSPLRTSLCVLLTLLNICRCFFLLLNFFKLSKHLPVLQFQARSSLHNVIIWQRHWMQSQWNIH